MGDSGPPCGVPSSAGLASPPSITPAFRKARMSLSTRLSVTRAATRAIKPSWLTRSKNFSRSKINDDVVASAMYRCAWAHGLVGRAPRSEAVTVLGERRIPLLLEDLQQGLLDQTIDDTRDAELSDPRPPAWVFRPVLPAAAGRFLRADETEWLASVHAGDPWRRRRFIPSTPGPPLFCRTRFHALSRFRWSHTSSISCAQAGLSGVGFATSGSDPSSPLTGGSPRPVGSKASEIWFFCRFPFMSRQSYSPLSIVRAFSHRFRFRLSVAPPFGLGVLTSLADVVT